MELIIIDKDIFFIPNPVNIGVVKVSPSSVALIDTGVDGDVARKILRLLDENGFKVDFIINTHSHADHIGGNAFIKEKTGAKIFASFLESAIVEYPILEPLYLFSGANPPSPLTGKFFLSKPSCVDIVITKKELKLNEVEFKVIPLPGHSTNQIGLEVDGVLFLADAIFSREILDKYKITFCVDINKYKDTLNWLRDSNYKFYVPAHAQPGESLKELIEFNLNNIKENENLILDILKEGKEVSEILKELCDYHRINITGMGEYYLINTPIMAYLSSLLSRRRLSFELKNNKLLWKRTGWF